VEISGLTGPVRNLGMPERPAARHRKPSGARRLGCRPLQSIAWAPRSPGNPHCRTPGCPPVVPRGRRRARGYGLVLLALEDRAPGSGCWSLSFQRQLRPGGEGQCEMSVRNRAQPV